MPPTPRHRRRAPETPSRLEDEIYRVAVGCDELAGDAVLELRGSMSLAELRDLLVDRLEGEMGLGERSRHGFEVGEGDEARHIDGEQTGRALLGGLGLEVGQILLCQLVSTEPDEEPYQLEIELLELGRAEEGKVYPHVSSWELQALEGFEDEDEEEPPPELDPDLEPLVQEIDQLLSLEATESDGDFPFLDAELAAGRRLLEATRDRSAQIESASEALDYDLIDWLTLIEVGLEKSKRFDEELALIDLMAAHPTHFPDLRSPRSAALIGLGRTDEARALVESLLTDGEASGDESMLAGAMHPLVELGELERAEAIARRLRASHDLAFRLVATETLVRICRETGRQQESRKLEREADRLAAQLEEQESVGPMPQLSDDTIRAMAESMGIDLDRTGIRPEDVRRGALAQASSPSPAQAPVVRSMPKVGRNDPCPCGSGQKYKKCHGA